MPHTASAFGSPIKNKKTLQAFRSRWRELASASVSASAWDAFAIEVFRFQVVENEVYRRYVELRGVIWQDVTDVNLIPHLPISAFRDHVIGVTLPHPPERIFRSSGTTSTTLEDRSKHHVDDLGWYDEVARKGFERAYGSVTDFPLLTLLPGYRDRPDSSLIHMARQFQAVQGFGVNSTAGIPLAQKIAQLQRASSHPTLLLGVTFALLDWVDTLSSDWPDGLPFDPARLMVMETGGMKGKRTEWTREEVHAYLGQTLHQTAIHSEYGMTELMSQAYSGGDGVFTPPPWLRVTIMEPDDPLDPATTGRTGRIRLTDLANLHSCAFIDTDDLGRLNEQGQFEVIGRFDSADVRGCSLLSV